MPSSDGTPGVSTIGTVSTALETPNLEKQPPRTSRNRLQKRHKAETELPLTPATEQRTSTRRGLRNLLQKKRRNTLVERLVGTPGVGANNGEGISDFMRRSEAEHQRDLERSATAKCNELERRERERMAQRRRAEERAEKVGRRFWDLPGRPQTVTRPHLRRDNWISEISDRSTYQVADDVEKYISNPPPNRLQRLASPWGSTSFSVFPKRPSGERNTSWNR